MNSATIYTSDTLETLSAGLQPASVCDEAINTARELSTERRELVLLEDSDGLWLVPAVGKCMEMRWTDDGIKPV